MRLDDAIRRRGFRRWYEAQLYEGHAYLVTGFLSLIMMAVALEVVDFRRSWSGIVTLVAVGGAGGAICIFAWRRFTRILGEAEYIAEQATCPNCHVYARFAVDRGEAHPEAVGGCMLHVRCRACGTAWRIA
jgi:hypothetical protein